MTRGGLNGGLLEQRLAVAVRSPRAPRRRAVLA